MERRKCKIHLCLSVLHDLYPKPQTRGFICSLRPGLQMHSSTRTTFEERMCIDIDFQQEIPQVQSCVEELQRAPQGGLITNPAN